MKVKHLIKELEKHDPEMEVIFMDMEQPKSPEQILVGVLIGGYDNPPDFLSIENLSEDGQYAPDDFGLDKWPEEKVLLLDG